MKPFWITSACIAGTTAALWAFEMPWYVVILPVAAFLAFCGFIFKSISKGR